MSDLPHLRIPGTQETEKYTYAGRTPQGVVFNLPPRNKSAHAIEVRSELQGAQTQAVKQRTANRQQYPDLVQWEPEGVVLTFHSDQDFELPLEKLERKGSGIYLLSLNEENGAQVAKVFVPEGRLGQFLHLVNAYANSVLLTFEADEDKEQQLKDRADPDNGIKLNGQVHKIDNKVRIAFLVLEAKEAAFTASVGELATLVKTGRKNEKLIESISSVRLALIQDFWQDSLPFPALDQEMWWEIWLRGTRATAETVHARFRDLAKIVGITKVSDRFVAFPERVVVHAYASANRLTASIDVLTLFAELRKAKELATYYVDLEPREQGEFIEDAVGRLELPGPNAPCVTILDGGVNRMHPLLEPGLAEEDMHTADPEWGFADSSNNQHGTGMAGIGLYGCLTEIMTETGEIILQHKLESVKILPPPPLVNSPPDYGRVMQDGVLLAHIKSPQRKRVLCMAVTADDRDMGLPTLWSGAVDDLCAGVLDETPKLMFISAGNVREHLHSDEYTYHTWNTTKAGIEDPAQAWNALTVGAITEKVMIQDEDFNGWQPIAECGDLCPTSRTSLPWPSENQKGWPIKPDIVMEGGNYAQIGANERSSTDDLSLLTTILHQSGRLFDTTRDTSPATALAARFAALIWSRYPKLWPETIRALMVHSATWNDRMIARFPGNSKVAAHNRLRCYGYGVPNLHRALNSAENAVTLTFEGELQPFQKINSKGKTFEMHLHQLPWPIIVLEALGEAKVTMRVTLSYFIEPSPNSVGWGVNHRYASHGLRFDVIRPTEEIEGFKRRISRDFWEAPNKRPENPAEETRNWVIGDQRRTHGSIHSDWWVGSAVELANCGRIVVYPVTGWWKERLHLQRYDSKARYSMIVSLDSENVEVDLYTPISQMVNVETEIME